MFLISCLDGPARGEHLVLEASAYIYFQIPDGRWIYYFQTWRQIRLISHEEKEEKSGNRKTKKRVTSQANYRYLKKEPWLESHPDVQVHLAYFQRTYGCRPIKL